MIVLKYGHLVYLTSQLGCDAIFSEDRTAPGFGKQGTPMFNTVIVKQCAIYKMFILFLCSPKGIFFSLLSQTEEGGREKDGEKH